MEIICCNGSKEVIKITNSVSRILALLLILVSITTAVLWEFYFDDRINTVPILQATGQIPKGHKILTSDLVSVRVQVNAIPEGAVSDISKVLGYEAAIPIKKGMLVVSDFFDNPAIVPDENQMITPIPNQWIFSLPGSLRRKDKVFIYGFPVADFHQSTSEASLLKGDSKENQDLKSRDNQLNYEPLLKDITVAFAKDSANQEVKPSDDKFQRIDATGNISQLELILTEEQFKLLEAKALNGYKFVFTYR